MDETVRGEIEAKLGADFGDVQIHTGQEAATAADGINARAFTVINHVAFNKEEYRPASHEGKKLIAHEWIHVRQQTEGAVSLLPKADAGLSGAGMTVGASVHVQSKLEVKFAERPGRARGRGDRPECNGN